MKVNLCRCEKHVYDVKNVICMYLCVSIEKQISIKQNTIITYVNCYMPAHVCLNLMRHE